MNRKFVLLLATSALLTGFQSQAETVGEALKKCSQEGDSLHRLVCYDKVTKEINQYSGLAQNVTAENEVKPAPTEPTQQAGEGQAANPETEFGLENQTPADQVDRIYAKVVDVTEDGYDRYTITLDSGAVWKQSEAGHLKIKPGMSIYVDRGMFGAFYMGTEEHNSRLKVKRLK